MYATSSGSKKIEALPIVLTDRSKESIVHSYLKYQKKYVPKATVNGFSPVLIDLDGKLLLNLNRI